METVDDGATSDKIVGKGGFGDSTTDLDSGGVVGRGSKTFGFNVESVQVSDKGVFERSVKVNGNNDNFDRAWVFLHGYFAFADLVMSFEELFVTEETSF